MQMRYALVKTQHENDFTYKHHMQFRSSAPTFRGSSDPWHGPDPWHVLPGPLE